jgi:preprotein translocase subunit SecA
MLDLLIKVFGNGNERKVKKLQPAVEYINSLEEEFSKLTDEELKNKTNEFREILANRKTSDDIKRDLELEAEVLESILPEAFATVREAGKRVLNMRHYDVQLLGGMVLHQGQIAEMRTGEGKTLVATAPAYLNALSGKGVHIVTVNDYLAKRDSEWMGQIFKFLGLSVGLVLSGDNNFGSFDRKKAAYACDITYGTNNEFGFDYLRDNMAASLEQYVQRPYNFAIVDEVDSILIDEARTPLIISGRLEQSAQTYKTMAKIAPKMKKELDYTVEEKNKNVILTEEGIDHAQEMLGIEDLFDASNQFAHHLLQALKAKELFNRDTDYVVKDGEIVIVDEFTGRLMQGRRWSDGLHQAIEAKEGVKIQDETQTLASITFQNLFRLYPKLSGMTGTAMTEEAEFGKIYSLEVTQVPTNKIDQRKDVTDVVYKTEKQKYLSVVDEIIEKNKEGRPVLVGTISIDKSELLSDLLKKRGLKHNVLNAKHHEREAQIISQAGRKGAVTIATNMAGRGTDILLGGNPEFLAKDIITIKGVKPENENYKEERQKALEEALEITKQEHEDVVQAGGLHVIGTERHESRRIDNQLRGRAARQGDPGSTRFFLSLEDNLMRIFGGDKVAAIMNTLNIEEDMAIESPLITRQIQKAQKKVETYHFDTRKHVLEYDDVMNQQRERFYAQRRKVLENSNLKEDILYMIECEVSRILNSYLSPEMVPMEYDPESLEDLVKSIHSTIPQLAQLSVKDIEGLAYVEIEEKLQFLAKEAYAQHEKLMSESYEKVADDGEENVVRLIEKDILLRVVDNKWIDHLHNIDMLREGIGLRAYGQKDPLIEYKREAFDLFNSMMFDIQREVVSYLFRAKVHVEVLSEHETNLSKAMEQFVQAAKSNEDKIGRNDPCPCGSGKKYKKCCGK